MGSSSGPRSGDEELGAELPSAEPLETRSTPAFPRLPAHSIRIPSHDRFWQSPNPRIARSIPSDPKQPRRRRRPSGACSPRRTVPMLSRSVTGPDKRSVWVCSRFGAIHLRDTVTCIDVLIDDATLTPHAKLLQRPGLPRPGGGPSRSTCSSPPGIGYPSISRWSRTSPIKSAAPNDPGSRSDPPHQEDVDELSEGERRASSDPNPRSAFLQPHRHVKVTHL